MVGVATPGVPNALTGVEAIDGAGVPGVPKRLVDGEFTGPLPNRLVVVDGVAVAADGVDEPKRLVVVDGAAGAGVAGAPKSDVVGAAVVAGAGALPATGKTVLGPQVTFEDAAAAVAMVLLNTMD